MICWPSKSPHCQVLSHRVRDKRISTREKKYVFGSLSIDTNVRRLCFLLSFVEVSSVEQLIVECYRLSCVFKV